MNDTISVHAAIDSLEAYVRQQDWVGFDPYDLKAHPRFAGWLRRRLTRPLALAASLLFPGTLRRLLDVKPVPHPKAMALFASAYLILYEITADERYRGLAATRLRWLVDHPSPGYSGFAWGLPFDYQGRDSVSSGTPTTVITAIAIQAFLQAYRLLGDQQYLDLADSACHFLAGDIPRYEPSPDKLCFSKSPGLQWHIHNSNLMTAAALAKTGQLLNRMEWIDLARRAVSYSLAEQRPDGAWYYWGPPDRIQHWIDHYHTGFVLRALDDIHRETGWDDLCEPLRRGYEYYISHLFGDNGMPRFTDRRKYPADIHGCAEAIICLGQLSTRFPAAYDKARATVQWTLDNMRQPDGYFYYRRYPGLTVKFPYMRWGQAWMLLALARHLQLMQTSSSACTD